MGSYLFWWNCIKLPHNPCVVGHISHFLFFLWKYKQKTRKTCNLGQHQLATLPCLVFPVQRFQEMNWISVKSLSWWDLGCRRSGPLCETSRCTTTSGRENVAGDVKVEALMAPLAVHSRVLWRSQSDGERGKACSLLLVPQLIRFLSLLSLYYLYISIYCRPVRISSLMCDLENGKCCLLCNSRTWLIHHIHPHDFPDMLLPTWPRPPPGTNDHLSAGWVGPEFTGDVVKGRGSPVFVGEVRRLRPSVEDSLTGPSRWPPPPTPR